MNAKVKMLWGISTTTLLMVIMLVACRKEPQQSGADEPRKLSIYLTDHACDYDSVFIDILAVEVEIDTCAHKGGNGHGYGHRKNNHGKNHGNGKGHDKYDNDDPHRKGCPYWDTLTINPGVYNVLNLRNGIDTLLASGMLPAGAVKRIRITLGTQNSVVVSGTAYPLNFLPGVPPYVYLKVDDDDLKDLGGGNYALWLDFDVCHSIINYNGQYYLKPYLKAFVPDRLGAVKGVVLPSWARPLVMVYNATDTGTTIPDYDDGEYKVRGLPTGTYSILFAANNGYKDSTIHNINVVAGQTTKVNTITLIK
jgi:hypothetical protein